MIRRLLFIGGFLLILNLAGFSQREFYNWYFGDSAGMSFNSGLPVTFLYSAMNAITNGESNISDSLGNILFYTNGRRFITGTTR